MDVIQPENGHSECGAQARRLNAVTTNNVGESHKYENEIIGCIGFGDGGGDAGDGTGLGQGEAGKIAAARRMGEGEAWEPRGKFVRGVSRSEGQGDGGVGDPRDFWAVGL